MVSIGDKRAHAASLSNIGGAYERLGEFEKALESYERSIAIYREVGNKGEGAVLNNLGLMYRTLGDDDRDRTFCGIFGDPSGV